MQNVTVTESSVIIEHLESRDSGAVAFLREVEESERAETVRQAIAVGVAGLRTMNARGDLDQVERGFEQLNRAFEQAFDPDRRSSYLGQLAETVDGYFGEDGVMAQTVSENGKTVLDEVLKRMGELHDLVVGRFATEDEREKSAAKGGDFEDQVESLLCRMARVFGDSVQNAAAEAGDAGRSKKGDFVVTLAEGPRFTVEAKNYGSTKLILTGKNGMLATLNGSMVNRQAEFGIVVTKEDACLPKEVGLFNHYGSDKVICVYGDEGAMLEVAYRWARAALLAAMEDAESDVDVEAVQTALGEARDAVIELGKMKAKATAIIQNANDISSIAETEATRAKAALGKAEVALARPRAIREIPALAS